MQLSCRECQMLIVMLRLGTWESACLVGNDQMTESLLKGAQPRTINLMGWVWQEATRLHAALCQLYGHALWITFQVSSAWATFWLVMQNLPAGLVWSNIGLHCCQVVSSFSFISPAFCFTCFWGKMQSKGSEEVPSIFDLAAIRKSQLTDLLTYFI